MSASTDLAVIIVSSSTARNLEFYSAVDHTRLKKIENLLAEPHEIALDPTRRLAYITHTYRAGAYGEPNEKAHEISIIDVDRQEITGIINIAPYKAPHDIEYDQLRDLLYVGVEDIDGRNGLVMVDPTERKVVGNVPLSAPNAHWLAVTPTGKVYVTHKEAPVVSAIDPGAREVVATIPMPGGAEELDADPSGDYVYVVTPKVKYEVGAPGQIFRVPLRDGDVVPRLVKIDTRTDEIVGEIEFDDYNSGIRVTTDGRVLVTRMRFLDRGVESPPGAARALPNGELIVVDGKTMTVQGRVDVGPMPITVRGSADASRAWVSNLGNGKVSVVDLAEVRVIAELHNNVGRGYGGTHGLTFVPPGKAPRAGGQAEAKRE